MYGHKTIRSQEPDFQKTNKLEIHVFGQDGFIKGRLSSPHTPAS